jgi:S-DNA-T family DNA segregation ATPase FtsK/SpoIIIE
VPLATTRGRAGRSLAAPRRISRGSGGSRKSRDSRSRTERLTELLERWAPPGGWLLVALALVTFSTAAGVIFPLSPAGIGLQTGVGSLGAPLVPAWCAWATWLLARRRRPPLLRVLSLLALSVTWLLGLTLREPQGGGLAGENLLRLLDEGFGRSAGLALVSILAAAGVVYLVGLDRILVGLHALWRTSLTAWRARPHTLTAQPRVRLPRPRNGTLTSPTEEEPVILGPGVGVQPDAASAPREREAARPERPRRVEPASVEHAWRRPDPNVLGRATDNGSFSPAELKARAKIIEETLESFNIQARVVEVQQGPAITQFGVDPAPGVAVNKIVQRQNDLALRLGAPTLRVLAPVPGRPMVGIEVPNTSVATVKLGDLMSAPQFTRARLPIGVGMDVAGKPVVADLTRMPHLLVAGATGSGKSVCINSLITSLLVMRSPEEVQFVMIDPKQVELSQYRGLPHLRLPVVTDMEKVVAALRWTVLEMERRYGLFAEVGARNIVAFNDRFPDERLVYLVIVIDELADMMMTAAEDVERLICRLAQLGRAAGVHLVVATQRPSVDVLTGLIKANLPTRIAFAVSSQIDSRVIMDRTGAERLLGRGDALYQAGDEMNPRRVQGAFASDDEIETVCAWWRQQGEAQHTAEDEAELEKLARQEDPEERLLAQAREILQSHEGDITPSYLARKLKIGIQKANRIHQTLVADEAAAYLVTDDTGGRP